MQLPSPNAERFGEIMQDFQPCFSVGLFLQSLEGRHLGVPSSAASHQHQAALRGHLVTLGETKKKKGEEGIDSSSGMEMELVKGRMFSLLP